MDWQKAISAIINFFRGLVRPVITIGLVCAFIFIVIELFIIFRAEVIVGRITPEMLIALLGTVMQFFFTITATVVAFWFGERKSKPADTNGTNGTS